MILRRLIVCLFKLRCVIKKRARSTLFIKRIHILYFEIDGCIAFGIGSEVVVFARQDRIQGNAEDCGDREASQRNVRGADGESKPVEKPRPLTRITAAIMRFLVFEKSTLFSTTLRTPIAEIIP